MIRALILAGLVCVFIFVSGCAGGQSLNWAELASEAKPTMTKGPCGTEVRWTREIEATETVEIVGELTIRAKCEARR